MQKLLQRQCFKALQLCKQARDPEKEKHHNHAIQDIHQPNRRSIAQSEQAEREEDDEENSGANNCGCGQDYQDHDVGDAAALQLIDAQPPTQPQKGTEVLSVHGVFSSSQVSLGAASASAPAASKKRSSSEPPWRNVSIGVCSTRLPLTMMPTCEHSFSTISNTCEVKNTVEPRAT